MARHARWPPTPQRDRSSPTYHASSSKPGSKFSENKMLKCSRAKAERAEMLFECDLGRKPASLEDASDGQPYLGVGGRGAGCKPYTHGTFGKPTTFLYLFPAVQRSACWFVADRVSLYAIAARYVVTVRNSLVSDDRQVVRVRGVVASNNDNKVQRILQ